MKGNISDAHLQKMMTLMLIMKTSVILKDRYSVTMATSVIQSQLIVCCSFIRMRECQIYDSLKMLKH